MSNLKEPNFFVTEANWPRGLDWYEALFTEPAAVRGESSTNYTRYPHHDGVPERMASIVPDAKLVFLVRDPIERVVSDYRYERWIAQREERSFGEAVAELESSRYVQSSRYALQLERFLPHYPQERIRVADLAELEQNPAATLAVLFRFLEVDGSFTSPDFRVAHNQSSLGARNRAGRVAVATLDRALGDGRSQALRDRAPAALVRLLAIGAVPQVSMDAGLRNRLESYLREDANRFRELTGRQFAHWCV